MNNIRVLIGDSARFEMWFISAIDAVPGDTSVRHYGDGTVSLFSVHVAMVTDGPQGLHDIECRQLDNTSMLMVTDDVIGIVTDARESTSLRVANSNRFIIIITIICVMFFY